MESAKQKAIESVVNRLIKEVDKEFEKGNNPYQDFDKLVFRLEKKHENET